MEDRRKQVDLIGSKIKNKTTWQECNEKYELYKKCSKVDSISHIPKNNIKLVRSYQN